LAVARAAGDGHPLLLAARQCVGSLFGLIQHANPVEAFERPTAKTNESIPRSAFRNHRTGTYSSGTGVMLRLASMAVGTASSVAMVVPSAAMAMVQPFAEE
jgi:hypothetical protein